MKVIEDLLTPNIYSRPARPIVAHLGLVWHWVANAGTTAKQNRDYFEAQQYQGRYAGAHYIIGLDGEVIHCIPDHEMAYHCGAKEYKPDALNLFGTYPNATTLGIECCHPDATGRFTGATQASLIELSARLAFRYGFVPCLNIVRHFDITGKECPRWFVREPDAFLAALGAVAARIVELKTETT